MPPARPPLTAPGHPIDPPQPDDQAAAAYQSALLDAAYAYALAQAGRVERIVVKRTGAPMRWLETE